MSSAGLSATGLSATGSSASGSAATHPVPGHPGLSYRVRGVTRRHGEVLANDAIDLDVHRAEVFGLLGPNGAGKTTLVRQLMGLLIPDDGTIELFGRALTADVAARSVAYLAQEEPALDDLSVALAVETTGRLRGLDRRTARRQRDLLIDELGLGPLAGRPLRRLSGGERRLAGVATALVGDRQVLVLDEPTTGLDAQARRAVWAALDRRRAQDGVTVVLVTHNVLEAESVLDRVAVLHAGRVIACDTPGRLKAQVSDEVRLEVAWRADPPEDATVAWLAERSVRSGRRWSARLGHDEAREALGRLTAGPAFAVLDDFTLATPTLEDVYLALGGTARDLERA